MKAKHIEVIEVRIWGRTAGALAFAPEKNCYAFEYEKSFAASGIEISPLEMPLSATEIYAFPNLPEDTYKRLPATIADSLPDDFGNALIDAWMADKGISKSEITTLDRLGYMNRRGMGALEFKPPRGEEKSRPTAIKLSELTEAAKKALTGRLSMESEELSKSAIAQMIQVGSSAGGARAKAVIAWNKETGEIRAGQFDTAPGFEHWLLKFDGTGKASNATQNYGRIEYAYSLMAKAAGIEMTECRLEKEGGRAHFMTRRFDRDGNGKLHVQTLCAMAQLDYKKTRTHSYSELFLTMKELKLDKKQFKEAFRRMAFNVMAGNCDDHPKNFAFLLPEGGKWRLAPAYDMTHSKDPKSKWTSAQFMSVNGKFNDIGKADLLEQAERAEVPDAKEELEKVSNAVARWKEFAQAGEVPASSLKKVGKDLNPL